MHLQEGLEYLTKIFNQVANPKLFILLNVQRGFLPVHSSQGGKAAWATASKRWTKGFFFQCCIHSLGKLPAARTSV